MAFLVWDNQQDADESLEAIKLMYGLPFVAPNGYRMDQWDVVRESKTTTNAGFFKPEERLGKGMVELMGALIEPFDEEDTMPEEFEPEEEEIEEDDD